MVVAGTEYHLNIVYFLRHLSDKFWKTLVQNIHYPICLGFYVVDL